MPTGFPYLLQCGFEGGVTNFDTAIQDADSKSSYPHYTVLAGRHGVVPARGAYCWKINQSIGTATNDCYQTQASVNLAASAYWASGFFLYLKGNTMTNGDRTTLWELDSAGGTNEVTLQLYYTTAGGLQLLLTETASTAVGSNPKCPIAENAWHWIELYGMVDAGGGNNGTAYLVVDGVAIGNVGSLDQGAITDLFVGLLDADAGHTAGIILFDDVTFGTDTSSVRLGYRSRAPWSIHVSAISTSSYGEHLFVGPGVVKSATLLTANAGDCIRLYDTDTGYTTGDVNLIAEANFSSGMPAIMGPIQFHRGCYCTVTAVGESGARGLVEIDPAPPGGFSGAKCYGNDAVTKYYALRRKARPGNV